MLAACAAPDLHLVDGELQNAAYRRSCKAMRSSEPWARIGAAQSASSGMAIGSASPGWAAPLRTVPLLHQQPNARICAMRRRPTGCTRDGSYAERVIADSRYCFSLAGRPLRCRARALAVRRADRLSRAPHSRRRCAPHRHLWLRRGRSPGRAALPLPKAEGESITFTRPGRGAAGGAFARSLGAVWAGQQRGGGALRGARRRAPSSRRSARSCRRRCRDVAKGGSARVRPASRPVEPDPGVFPMRSPVGRAARGLGGRSRAPRRGGNSSRWRSASRPLARPCHDVPAGGRQRGARPRCARARLSWRSGADDGLTIHNEEGRLS